MLPSMKVTSVSNEETTSLTEAKVSSALHKIKIIFQMLSAGLNTNVFLMPYYSCFPKQNWLK